VALPAQAKYIVLYLLYLGRAANTFSTINLAVCSIKWAHNIAGLDSPTDNILVSETLNGLKRRLAQPKVQKYPLKLEHINKLIDIKDNSSPADIRNTCVMVLAFYAFLRVDELKNIRTHHLIFHEGHLEIRINRAKNDQLRKGNVVVVANLDTNYCPVWLLRAYLNKVGMNIEKDQYVFRRFFHIKKNSVLNVKDEPLNYSRYRDIVKEKTKQLGLYEKKYSTHSMRAGGATCAANANLNERLFQRHGRWASVGAKNMYIEDSLQNRLKVSRVISECS
jgi:integrase